MKLMDVGEFNGHRLYTVLMLDNRLSLCALTSASCAISVLIIAVGFIIIIILLLLLLCCSMWLLLYKMF